MKNLTKKQFKKLSKGDAYREYNSVAELADELQISLDEAKELFEEARQHYFDAKADAEIARAEAGRAKAQAKLAEERAEKAEAEIAKGHGKVDAGLQIINTVQEDLDELTAKRKEDFLQYKDLGDELGSYRDVINLRNGTIKHTKNIIARKQRDIDKGIDVNRNKKTIARLEAQIRMEQRQIEAFELDFKRDKEARTILSTSIDAMDTEINDKVKLGELLNKYYAEGVN